MAAEYEFSERDENALWKVHGELVRIEAHWTDQIQAQQQRQAVVLSASGVLLGLLAAGAFQSGFAKLAGWQRGAIVLATALVACSIVFAGCALTSYRNLRKIWGVRLVLPAQRLALGSSLAWLDSRRVWLGFICRPENSPLRSHWLAVSCATASRNQRGNLNHENARLARRRLLHIQLILLGSAGALLAAAVVGQVTR